MELLTSQIANGQSLLFGYDFSLAIFLSIENALEGKIWLNQIWFGYYSG
jgi:hypothetical protein